MSENGKYVFDQDKIKKIYESTNMILPVGNSEEEKEDLNIIERKVKRAHRLAYKIVDMINSEVSTDFDKVLVSRSLSMCLLSGIRTLSLELEERDAMLCMYNATKKALKMIGYYDNGGYDVTINRKNSGRFNSEVHNASSGDFVKVEDVYYKIVGEDLIKSTSNNGLYVEFDDGTRYRNEDGALIKIETTSDNDGE